MEETPVNFDFLIADLFDMSEKPETASAFLKNLLLFGCDEIKPEEFNLSFSRLMRSGMIERRKNGYIMTDDARRYFVAYDLSERDLEESDFINYYANYFDGIEAAEFLSKEEYDSVIAEINKKNEKEEKKKKSAVWKLVLGLIFAAAGIGGIITAATVQDQNRIIANIFGFSALPCMAVSVIFLIMSLSGIMQKELDYKKSKFEKGGIKCIKIDIERDRLEKLLSARLRPLPAEGFYAKAAWHNMDYIIGGSNSYSSRFNYKLVSVFETDDNEYALEKTREVVKSFCYGDAVYSKLVHRISIAFIFKSHVTEEDKKFMEKHYNYGIVGEFPMVRVPLLLPILYDKTNRELYYKGNKIPWGLGSCFNYSLRFIEKLVKNYSAEYARKYKVK